MSRQHCCWDTCQITEQLEKFYPKSQGLETSQDLMPRRLCIYIYIYILNMGSCISYRSQAHSSEPSISAVTWHYHKHLSQWQPSFDLKAMLLLVNTCNKLSTTSHRSSNTSPGQCKLDSFVIQSLKNLSWSQSVCLLGHQKPRLRLAWLTHCGLVMSYGKSSTQIWINFGSLNGLLPDSTKLAWTDVD